MKKFDRIFNVNDTEIKVKGYKGTPVNKWGGMRYRHKIILAANDNEVNFDFYGSEMDYSRGHEYLDEKDMLTVVDCIFSDALSYANAIDMSDFIQEFGYDDNWKEGARVFNACSQTYHKLTNELGIAAEMISDVLNYINEQY